MFHCFLQIISYAQRPHCIVIYKWFICGCYGQWIYFSLHFSCLTQVDQRQSYSSQQKWNNKSPLLLFSLFYFRMRRDDVSFRSSIPHKGATSKYIQKNKRKKMKEKGKKMCGRVRSTDLWSWSLPQNHRTDMLHDLTWQRSTVGETEKNKGNGAIRYALIHPHHRILR